MGEGVRGGKRGRGDPICIAFVGINFVERTRRPQTPAHRRQEIQRPNPEAAQAEQGLKDKAQSAFDEFQILRFRATNAKPFPFAWVDLSRTEMEYSVSPNACLARI